MTEPTKSRLRDICFDCHYPAGLARFWAPVLNYTLRPYTDEDIEWLRSQGIEDVDDDPTVPIDAPDGGPRIWFNRVPEAKTAKNRVHIDVNLDSWEQYDWLISLGATMLYPPGSIPDARWAIMADPEGNEFCAFPPSSATAPE
jgi:Glyoxalase-like domain